MKWSYLSESCTFPLWKQSKRWASHSIPSSPLLPIYTPYTPHSPNLTKYLYYFFFATEYNAAIVSFIFRLCNFTTFFRCCTLMSTLLESIERSYACCLFPKNRMDQKTFRSRVHWDSRQTLGRSGSWGKWGWRGGRERWRGQSWQSLRNIHSWLLFDFDSFKCKRFESTKGYPALHGCCVKEYAIRFRCISIGLCFCSDSDKLIICWNIKCILLHRGDLMIPS